jgi:hypothetical protein
LELKMPDFRSVGAPTSVVARDRAQLTKRRRPVLCLFAMSLSQNQHSAGDAEQPLRLYPEPVWL